MKKLSTLGLILMLAWIPWFIFYAITKIFIDPAWILGIEAAGGILYLYTINKH